MVLKITNLHILRYLPIYWLYLLECYTIDNQRCTHTASRDNKSADLATMTLLFLICHVAYIIQQSASFCSCHPRRCGDVS